jgi:DNA-binding transcriptional regulator YiaG
VRLAAQKPKSPKYPKKLETLGDHIRKRRLDLGLFQKEVAQQIGVDTTTIYNWERNANSPQVHQLPRVIRFLGYNPHPAAGSLPEKLTAIRRKLGLSQRVMAKRLGIDPGTLRNWENGRRCPSKKLQQNISDFLRSPESGFD